MSTVATSQDLTNEIVNSFEVADFTTAIENRKKAIEVLKATGLPGSKHEEYRFTPITKNLEKKFTWKSQPVLASLNSVDEFMIPELDAFVLVLINGSYSKELSTREFPKGITVSSLKDALASNHPAAAKYFDKVVNSETDSYAALNTAFWQDGIFIHVPESTTIEKTFLVLHVSDSNQESTISHTRILGVIENNSSIHIVEKFDAVDKNSVFHTLSEEFVIGEQASFEYCKIQNDSKQNQVTNSVIHQSNSSKVNTFTLTLNGELIRNNFNIIIDGENCESHFHGLYLLNGNTVADNHTVVDHRKPNSFSNEMYKGILDGNSKGVFNGKIFVRPQAQKTNAFQSNRNILLSDKSHHQHQATA
jgi:Fe-S cluster assembly protein SufD